MPIRSVTLRILGESKDALAKMKLVNAEADKLEKRKVTVKIGVDLNQADVSALKAKVTALGKLTATINVKLDTPSILADFAKIKTELAALRTLASGITVAPAIDIAGINKATAALTAFNKASASAKAGLVGTTATAVATNSVLAGLFTRGNGWGFWGNLATGKVKLFAGLFGAIGGLHLLVDAIVEVAAVWIPATIAAGAFGIAASDAVVLVMHHMQNLHTVADATHQAIPPMTNAMEKLHKAVQPAVFQVFGDALTVINQKSGLFSQLAKGAATVVEQLAARMAIAVTHGKGFDSFLVAGVTDLSRLGNSFGDLFGIIGNLIHAVPGYAEILLQFGEGFLKLIEYVTMIGEPFIKLGLYVHGFIVWAGLGATAGWALIKMLGLLGGTAIGTAIKGIFSAAFAAATMAGSFDVATFSLGLFDAAMVALGAVNPLIWIGAAVGGLIALTLWLKNSGSASAAWATTLQKNIDSATTISQGLNLAQSALLTSAAKLGEANIKLAHTQQTVASVNLHTGIATRVVSGAYTQQQNVVNATRAAYEKFNQEVDFNRGRMQGLEKVYGTQTQVMGLLNAAGVTQAEWQDRTAGGWLLITQKINATIAGYKAMGQTGGTLVADMNVLDRTVTDQYQAMAKLNQAWDQFINDVTGTQNSFDTVALGFKTLQNNATTASNTLAHAHLSISGLGTAMDGLTKNDLALNQAFQQQVVNLNTMFDSWRQAGLATNIFNSGVKAGIAPLLRYAQGSKSATYELIALAQEAGFKGVPTLQNLTKWVGNTHGALQKMKAASNQATIQEALLTTSMKAQGQYLSTQLLRDIDNAVLKYKGVTTAADNYAKAIANQGIQSQAAHTARDQLVRDIYNAERQMGATKGAAEKLTAAMLKIPTNIVANIIEHGTGNFSINGIFGKNPVNNPPLIHPNSGTLVPGLGNTDSVLGLLTPGELVVPKHLVRSGAVDHLKGMIPGFASGGLIQRGDLSVLSGQAATAFNTNFENKFTLAMESAMTAAMKKAMAQARSMAALGGSGGPASASARAFQAYAFSLFPLYGWGANQRAPLVALWNGESGWNNMARNPSSGAFGIPQALPPGKMGAAAAGGNGAAQIRWGEGYIHSVYGTPANAYGTWLSRSPHWYGGGLSGGLFTKPTLIGVGDSPEVVNIQPLSRPASAIHSRGGDVYNITVAGDTDPDAAALRIIQKIARYKKKRGNAALGIG